MNPAAPSPSDSSIAQAFRDYAHLWPLSWAVEFVDKRAREIEASAPAAAVGGDGLDFEPDDNHTASDMANVGYSLMQAIKRNLPDYCWNESPAEIVGDLLNQIEEAKATPAAPVDGECQHCGKDMVVTGCVSCGEPAAPVGGFVVVPDWVAEILAPGNWRDVHPGRPCKKLSVTYAVEQYQKIVDALAASPAAQSSAKDGVRVDAYDDGTGRARDYSGAGGVVAEDQHWYDPKGEATFKNFHRSLCDRFGYTHDAEYWWRDLISLEEHIAKATAASGLVDGYTREQIMAGLKDHYKMVSGDSRETPATQMAHEVMQVIEKAAIGREESK